MPSTPVLRTIINRAYKFIISKAEHYKVFSFVAIWQCGYRFNIAKATSPKQGLAHGTNSTWNAGTNNHKAVTMTLVAVADLFYTQGLDS